jgi:sulfotransferase 6B1
MAPNLISGKLLGAKTLVLDRVQSSRRPDLPPLFANSMPKAGTHLQERMFDLLGYRLSSILELGPSSGQAALSDAQIALVSRRLRRLRPGCSIRAHAFHFPELERHIIGNDVKTVTIVRDPRDVCVSDAFYVARTPGHRLHAHYRALDEAGRIMASIVGVESGALGGAAPSLGIAEHYRRFLPWLERGPGMVVRFEDLVGPRGGGSDEAQRAALGGIVEHLGLDLGAAEVERVRGDIFWEGSSTFRKGQIGSWADHFTPDHTGAFEASFGDLLQSFGYGS